MAFFARIVPILSYVCDPFHPVIADFVASSIISIPVSTSPWFAEHAPAPPIAYYCADRLDAQLDQAAGAFINSGSVRWDPGRGTLWLSKIFGWYEQDFGGTQAMLDLIQKHSRSEDIHNLPPLIKLKLSYFPYDWRINHFGQG